MHKVFFAHLFEQSSLLWSDPVGARRRRAKVLRRRVPPVTEQAGIRHRPKFDLGLKSAAHTLHF